MRFRKADKKTKTSQDQDAAAQSGNPAALTVGGWKERKRKVHWVDFPVPGQKDQPLRVNFSKEAYAQTVGHTKENLDEEVCGVLAGELCEDGDGDHVLVSASIRGTSARHGSAHVTFTQETWNQIHADMERDYPKLRIVGWYHSHPGFGVAFSDMDLFIQENFFGSHGQLAYVIDPISGEEAMCAKLDSQIQHFSHFWVDGRERLCTASSVVPAADQAGSESESVHSPKLKTIEERVNQSLHAVEELRLTLHRFLFFVGMIVALGVVAWIGLTVYRQYTAESRPPEITAFSREPFKRMDGIWCYIGAQTFMLPLSPNDQTLLNQQEKAMHEKQVAPVDTVRHAPPDSSAIRHATDSLHTATPKENAP